MSYLKSLNPLQLRAARYGKGPLLVLAGAGSGKTKVLTSRIAHLVLDKKVRPESILAVTFTNKAAQEIKERLEKLIGERAERIWAGTFHTIGLRIIREEARHFGLKSSLTIYDEEEQLLLVNYVMSELSMNNKDLPYKTVLWEINLAKNNCLSPDEYARRGESDLRDAIAPIYRAYQRKLRAMNAVDFGDLIMKPIELLNTNEAALRKYRDRFSSILIDEYQDTNRSQYTMTRLLASGQADLCAVGDPDQSIYGWRGASIENILKFQEDYKDAVVIKLEQNYRSTSNILGAANSVIMNNEDRIEKNLWTGNGQGEPVTYEECLNEDEEARFVVKEIKRLKASDPAMKFKDCTILYRTNTQSRPFEELFFEEGIPYTIIGGFRFFDRREIKDSLAYLKAIQNPDDSLNFLRIVNVPPRGIGKATLEKVHRISDAHDASLYEAFRKARKEGALNQDASDFIGTFEMLREEMPGMPLHDFVGRVLDLTGYEDFWARKRTEEADVRVKNLQGLVASVKKYVEAHPKASLADYLNLVSLMSDADQVEDKHNRVTLMTIHSAKGLEFPVVFMVGMEEGLFPHKRSIDEETEEEERRLCYVGMTRARRLLFLTSAKHRTSGKETSSQLPSRFIAEIDAAFVTKKAYVPAERIREHMDAIRKILNQA
ncbi:MAG: UvrD-helicase domain-containing protein [Deltaproteobacteria bacterium]|nr:UvrD-helicase domain-containing protein [Deltaproteobacteria bacterium]MBZ0219736.1 UvrD-helicase domain-containing protein [Deltaproteobacteria bacterium]